MQIISQANETVVTLLKRFQKTSDQTRMMKYCAHTPVDEGILLFNLLTRELVLLTQEEFSQATQLEYLKTHWFAVPEDTDEKELASFVRWALKTRQKKDGCISGYTIFPTTDCNARCFYCFELGRSRMPMSQETALKVVQYIKNHHGDKDVHINWFGGEPLFNQAVIDTICDGLRKEGITFESTVISNGYLFDDETVRKAVESWNVKRVQITLDGTEAVYNKTKAYIYRQGNPYQIVMGNMERLLDAQIPVIVRMNMDLHNAEDLLQLSKELGQRFGGRKRIQAYVRHIFDDDQPIAERHDATGWTLREEALARVEEQLAVYGLESKRGVSRGLRTTLCKADCGHAVTILPDGNIGLCEHFSESEFIGHIDREGFDQTVVDSWKQTMPEIPECADCFCYPECIKLVKCANTKLCFLQQRQWELRRTQRQMVNEYRHWQKQTLTESSDDLNMTDC